MITRCLSFLSWNVRGLGQTDRCEDVLSALISQRPTVAALQETKLTTLTPSKKKLFLPSRLASCATRPSIGASGGILTAWDSSVLSLCSSNANEFSLTVKLALLADGSTLTVTNVYAPTVHSEKTRFLDELASLARDVSGPWLIFGDFNLTRTPSDKNKGPFNFHEANLFNEMINNVGLIEIPLVERAYTWSNKRENPTLVRLDRCLVNLDWDDSFPNTCLASLTRDASDHVPLLLTASTTIPKGGCFRFENSWHRHQAFKESMRSVIASTINGRPGKSFIARLKSCRKAGRNWARRLRPINQRENDTKVLLDALDRLEEC